MTIQVKFNNPGISFSETCLGFLDLALSEECGFIPDTDYSITDEGDFTFSVSFAPGKAFTYEDEESTRTFLERDANFKSIEVIR